MKPWEDGGSFYFFLFRQWTGLRPAVWNSYIFSNKVMYKDFKWGWAFF